MATSLQKLPSLSLESQHSQKFNFVVWETVSSLDRYIFVIDDIRDSTQLQSASFSEKSRFEMINGCFLSQRYFEPPPITADNCENSSLFEHMAETLHVLVSRKLIWALTNSRIDEPEKLNCFEFFLLFSFEELCISIYELEQFLFL